MVVQVILKILIYLSKFIKSTFIKKKIDYSINAISGVDGLNPTLKIIKFSINNNLKKINIKWSKEKSMTIVLCAKGYPGKYKKNILISNLKNLKENSTSKLSELKEKVNSLEKGLEKEEDKPRQIAEKRYPGGSVFIKATKWSKNYSRSCVHNVCR